MKPKILLECPLLIELFEAYLSTDALIIERQKEDNDVPEESSEEVVFDTKAAYTDELDILLNEYLDMFDLEDTEAISAVDEEDTVVLTIHQIISEIIELLPDAKTVRINAETLSSIFVYCESLGDDQNDSN